MKFENQLVLDQLRYSGMLETIRIRRAGFPVRLKFEAFAKRWVNTLCTTLTSYCTFYFQISLSSSRSTCDYQRRASRLRSAYGGER